MDPLPTVFDRRSVRRNRTRASHNIAQHDFLYLEVAKQVLERLSLIKRTFKRSLDLGCHTGHLKNASELPLGTEIFINSDPSEDMAISAGGPSIVSDEENLPFADQSLDLIVSSLTLHWVNDLPRALAQIFRCLRPDGLFLAAMFGEDTLDKLRRSLASAADGHNRELFPRVSPFIQIKELGNLLQRTGFTMSVVDIERVTVDYPSLLSLLKDLRGMGEANALNNRCKHFTPRSILQDAENFYPQNSNGNKRGIRANFDILYAIGWAPHKIQRPPLNPGSAKTAMRDALE